MCRSNRVDGSPCANVIGLDENGLCSIHQPGGAERLRVAQSLGGQARTKQLDAAPIGLEEIRPAETERDVMLSCDDLVRWGLTGRITQGVQRECTNTLKVRLLAMAQDRTRKLEDELMAELDAKTARIQELEREVAMLRQQGLRAVRRA
jgi:hypothetical protein